MKKKSKIAFGRLDLLRNDTLLEEVLIHLLDTHIGYQLDLIINLNLLLEYFQKIKKNLNLLVRHWDWLMIVVTVIISLWHQQNQKEMTVFKLLE